MQSVRKINCTRFVCDHDWIWKTFPFMYNLRRTGKRVKNWSVVVVVYPLIHLQIKRRVLISLENVLVHVIAIFMVVCQWKKVSLSQSGCFLGLSIVDCHFVTHFVFRLWLILLGALHYILKESFYVFTRFQISEWWLFLKQNGWFLFLQSECSCTVNLLKGWLDSWQ